MQDWISCFRRSFVSVLSAALNCWYSFRHIPIDWRGDPALCALIPLRCALFLEGTPCFYTHLLSPDGVPLSISDDHPLFFVWWWSACMSCSRLMTSLLSPLHFVNVQLVEESLEDGLHVLSIHTCSGKSAATVELRLGLASRCFCR